MIETKQGQRVIVTGASSGIGSATAKLFLNNRASVALIGRREDALRAAATDRANDSGKAIIIAADLADEKQSEMAFAQAIGTLGGLDVLVNAAGILKAGHIEATTLALWDEMVNINLRSVFQLMQLAVPHLAASRGNIVNVSSVTGLRSFPGVLAYCVSKAAVDQLTRCAALELAPKGVRVNAVNPGVVITEIHKRVGMSEDNYANFLEHSKTTHPLGRVGRANEVAELVFYLASEKASWRSEERRVGKECRDRWSQQH